MKGDNDVETWYAWTLGAAGMFAVGRWIYTALSSKAEKENLVALQIKLDKVDKSILDLSIQQAKVDVRLEDIEEVLENANVKLDKILLNGHAKKRRK